MTFHFFRILISTFAITVSSQVLAQRPNILWITCEDISPTLPMYGDSTAHTPNLNKLAAESLVYTQAFATVGVCAPSRSSIITGMYPTAIGTHHMRTGKDVRGWGARQYTQPSHALDVNNERVPLYSVVTPPEVKCFTEYLRAAGYYCTNNAKTDYQFAAPLTAWDENSTKAHWKNRKPGQPFFAVFNIMVTHESYLWRNKDKPLTVDPARVPVPPYFPDTETVRNDIARNYSNIERMDAQLGAKLKALEKEGLLDNTIIFFFSDHGGPLPRGKREHYESGLRVPLMVRLPRQKKQQYIDELISFVDLAPTILSLAGLPIPEHFQGQAFLGPDKGSPRAYVYGSGDRFDEFTDRVRTVINKDYIYVKNYLPNRPAYKDTRFRKDIDTMQELLVLRDKGKLNKAQGYWFRTKKTAEEFYIRSEDPFNLNNQVDNPRYKDTVQQMREALLNWEETVGDMGAIPEKKLYYTMWPYGKQPQAPKPEVTINEQNEVMISTTLKGASLAYLITKDSITPAPDSGWQLYSSPFTLRKGERLYAINTRIGFKDSDVVEMHHLN